ncbi:hypothetical protein H5410_052276 [Solanum commersonii]|uniref:Uncharacterized protein n=1 Tax=Solanum commersonii TaxID=4109 RepID=A0A9J5X0E0_SOLCO|nr:hypothetical protein H5410_052276 [Solanum commersonii]
MTKQQSQQENFKRLERSKERRQWKVVQIIQVKIALLHSQRCHENCNDVDVVVFIDDVVFNSVGYDNLQMKCKLKIEKNSTLASIEYKVKQEYKEKRIQHHSMGKLKIFYADLISTKYKFSRILCLHLTTMLSIVSDSSIQSLFKLSFVIFNEF